MKRIRSLLLALLFGIFVVGGFACEQEGPVEQTGEQMEEGTEEAGEEMEETAEEAEEDIE